MKLLRITAIITGLIALMVGAGLVFCLVVNIDFSTPVSGQLVPQKYNVLTSAHSGRVIRLHPVGPVREGDVILELDSDSEMETLDLLHQMEKVLNRRIEWEKEYLRLSRERQQKEKEYLEAKIASLKQEYELYRQQLLPLQKKIASHREAALALSERYRLTELKVLRELAEADLIPKRELRQAEFNAENVRLQKAEGALQQQINQANQKREMLRIERTRRETQFQLTQIDDQPEPRERLLNLELEHLRLLREIRELEREIRRFTLKAPYDGQLLSWTIRAGDYINVGKKVAVIADTSRYLFHGSLANADRLLMRKGQQAYLSLKNYPHQKYGYLSAEVLRIETVIDDQSQQSQHHVWLTVTPPEIPLYPGLQGIAYVTTFRGTIFDYLIRGADPHYIPHHQRPPSNP